jgi:hypothetical protein
MIYAPANCDYGIDASHAKSLHYQNNLLKFHMPNAEVLHVVFDIFSASDILQQQLLKIGQLNAQNPTVCYTEKPPPSSAFRHEHAIPLQFVGKSQSSAGRPITALGRGSIPPLEPLSRSGLGDANPHMALV